MQFGYYCQMFRSLHISFHILTWHVPDLVPSRVPESLVRDLSLRLNPFYTKANRFLNFRYICYFFFVNNFQLLIYFRSWSSRGAGVQARDCKRNGCRLDFHFGEWNIKYFHILILVTRQNVALCSTSQYEMPREFSGKWGTEVS